MLIRILFFFASNRNDLTQAKQNYYKNVVGDGAEGKKHTIWLTKSKEIRRQTQKEEPGNSAVGETESCDYLMASFVFFFLKSFRSSQSPTAVESGGQGISIYIPIKITNPGREFP